MLIKFVYVILSMSHGNDIRDTNINTSIVHICALSYTIYSVLQNIEKDTLMNHIVYSITLLFSMLQPNL